MIRALIAGALAFAAAYAAERQLENVQKDIKRYDSLRAMSGEPPLFRELIAKAGELFAGVAAERQGEARSLLTAIQADVLRYARIRGM